MFEAGPAYLLRHPRGLSDNTTMREGGVEPPRPLGHTALNRVRLPFRHSRERCPRGELNLPRPLGHTGLNGARLPVPPPGLMHDQGIAPCEGNV